MQLIGGVKIFFQMLSFAINQHQHNYYHRSYITELIYDGITINPHHGSRSNHWIEMYLTDCKSSKSLKVQQTPIKFHQNF